MKAIRSRDNALVKHWHALAHSARDRRKSGQTLLDGAHLLRAALDAGCPFEALIVSESGLEQAEISGLCAALPPGVQRYLLTDALFRHVSPVDTPAGVLAVVEPAAVLVDEGSEILRPESLIALDAVQDPGNLGTILRTAAAAGIRRALLGEGCAHAWSPRVLRAGMGAHFALRIEEGLDLPARLAGYPGVRIATALGAGARPLYDLDLRGPVAWLFGAEGKGLSRELLACADQRAVIPMLGAMESLNVGAAAAVCLFEQARQLRSR